MEKLLAVIKGELKRYFASPLAVVYLVCFLIFNASFALYFGGIFTSGNATLRPMFDFMPWIYLLFVSGIAMRLWSEEFKGKTILQIMTMPVSVTIYVWGKFLAAWLFCIFGLLLTFPFVITINILGDPDNGIIFNSYLGAVILAGAMLAIAQTASAMTKSQVISLVIAVIFNLLFFLCGLEYVLGFLRGFTSDYFVETFASFSFLTHVADFNSGVLKLNDVIFFGFLIVMFNNFTTMIVARRTAGVTTWLKLSSNVECWVAGMLIGLAFIGINLFINNIFDGRQIDWTAEKLFTPSPSAENVLKKLSSNVTAKVYYTKLLGERDEVIRLNFENLRRLLKKYKKLSGGNFNYRIYDTEPLSEEEDQAITAGLQGLPISDLNAAAYFGMVLSNDKGNSRSIPFFIKQRNNLLEQDIIENVYLLEHKPLKLGILTDLPMMGGSNGNGVIKAPWQIIDVLQDYYEIINVKYPEDLDKIDLLMMVHPQRMGKDMENAVYNFSISGGKILAFFDIMVESLELTNTRSVSFGSSDYGSLPDKWGFHFYNDMAVADLENSTQVTIDTPDYSGTTQDLIQFYITQENMFDDLPEVAQLKRILMTSASVFMPLRDAKIYFVPLMQASKISSVVPANMVTQRIHPAEIMRRFKADEQPKYIAAHIISQQEDKPFELVVVGDVDMLYDSFWTTNIPLGKQIYRVPLLDNVNFVLNALEMLSGNDLLLSLRGKSPKLRSFSNLERKQKQILRDYKVKEKDVFDQITLIKRGLSEIYAKRDFEMRSNFTPEELSLINKIRRDLSNKKEELYDIRLKLNRYMERVEVLVKLFNIYMIPLLILLVFGWKSRHNFACYKVEKIKFNRQIGWLALVTVAILALGIACYYMQKQQNQDEYRNQKMFAGFEQQIDQVAEISIKNRQNELIFVKQDGVWKLRGHEEFLVAQNRIANFLNALSEAKIYEKIAERIENMEVFGLAPLENETSKMTRIELKDGNGRSVLSFDVGNYNVDLGRGAMGAYVKLADKFQIWLSKIELIDLNLDYHYWTFADLWNLHFGRIADVNNIGKSEITAKIVALLLNTKLGKKLDYLTENNLIMSLHLRGEYFDNLKLDFSEQEGHYYVHFNFNGIQNHPLLEKFADVMNGYYEIDSEDMEKFGNVIPTREE